MLYVPEMPYSLMSVSRLALSGWEFRAKGAVGEIRDEKAKLVFTVPVRGRVYPILTQKRVHGVAASAKQMSVMELHARLGHISPEAAKRLVREKMVEGLSLDTTSAIMFCEACVKGKQSREVVTNHGRQQWETSYIPTYGALQGLSPEGRRNILLPSPTTIRTTPTSTSSLSRAIPSINTRVILNSWRLNIE